MILLKEMERDVLGQVFLHIGIKRFHGNKKNKWMLGAIFAAFILFYPSDWTLQQNKN